MFCGGQLNISIVLGVAERCCYAAKLKSCGCNLICNVVVVSGA